MKLTNNIPSYVFEHIKQDGPDPGVLNVAVPGKLLKALRRHAHATNRPGMPLNGAIGRIVRQALLEYMKKHADPVRLAAPGSSPASIDELDDKELRREVRRLRDTAPEASSGAALDQMRLRTRLHSVLKDGITLEDIATGLGFKESELQPILDGSDVVDYETVDAVKFWLKYFGYP